MNAENTDDTEQAVTLTREGAVATVTLLRPSLSVAVKTQLRDALLQVAADDTVRAVVLTGTGRAFCFGQDLAEHADELEHAGDQGDALSTVESHYNPIVLALTTMPKPVIAAINGTCVGAGLGFALACDLRLAAAGSKLGTAFTAIGLTCDSGLSASLARAVGSSRAVELVLLAETFTAEQAKDWGLLRDVLPVDELATTAANLAAHLAAGPTAAYAESKALLADPLLAGALTAEAAGQARLGRTADHRGAVRAFLAKQKPTFTGR
ncbi:MAG: enoyl-CoA hydratase-related protein [Mycobacteriaceae bacterium]